MREVQLTIDGREEPLRAPLTPVQGSAQGKPLPLFDPRAFAPAVPGTLALPVDQD